MKTKKDNKIWLTIEYISEQERFVKKVTEEKWGKDKNGFCDIALDGIELLIQGVGYLADIKEQSQREKWGDFNQALRAYTFYHYYRINYTFKAAYNLIHEGYYTEAAILMRNIVETFVKIKFLALKSDVKFINSAFAGHYDKNNKNKVDYKTQFDLVSPGLYEYYRHLCDIAHGALASFYLKTTLKDYKFELDHGVIFKTKASSFIINQFLVYLLAHLEYMLVIYPEIKQNMPKNFAEKYNSVKKNLWIHMKELSEQTKTKRWYLAIEKLVKNKQTSDYKK